MIHIVRATVFVQTCLQEIIQAKYSYPADIISMCSLVKEMHTSAQDEWWVDTLRTFAPKTLGRILAPMCVWASATKSQQKQQKGPPKKNTNKQRKTALCSLSLGNATKSINICFIIDINI